MFISAERFAGVHLAKRPVQRGLGRGGRARDVLGAALADVADLLTRCGVDR